MSVIVNRRWVELEAEACHMAYVELERRLIATFVETKGKDVLDHVIQQRLDILSHDDEDDVHDHL